MNVAILGSGGREHALLKALSQSSKVEKIVCVPGSDGIALEFECKNISLEAENELIEFFNNEKVEFVIIGPEDPLVSGLADTLRKNGFKVFGPGAEGARLEGSKIYSKNFMRAANIPTAGFAIARTKLESMQCYKNFKFPLVVKADVLAAGKGVYICQSEAEYFAAIEVIFDQKKFGVSEVLIEEYISGWELSYICITNGLDYQVCPLTQDHKALRDAGVGPNTGGMGVFGPVDIGKELEDKINSTIVEPTLKELRQRKIDFSGALFIGLMIENQNPYVLEYNVRFGDPETQIIMPLIDGDIFEILYSSVVGPLMTVKKKKDVYAACVVLAAEGYPDNALKGSKIELLDLSQNLEQYFIFSGVKSLANKLVVNGGRVMGAVGIGNSKTDAIDKAYAQSEKVIWKGLQKRSDIGNYFKK